MKLVDFPWPPLVDSVEPPQWNGRCFIVGSFEKRFLAYGSTESGWSSELTALHKIEAGLSHPINVASRSLALRSMKGLRGSPVILDIGCSSGFLIEDLRREIPNAQIIGSDYLSDVLEDASRRIPEIPFVQFDLRKCPLPDCCVEGVTALNVLEHIDDDLTALREIHRILRPGGIAHIEVPAGPGCYDVYDEVLLHFRRYRLKDLMRLAEIAGLRIESTSHLGFFLFPLFSWMKEKNRSETKHLTLEQKHSLVAAQIRKTAGSRALKAVLGIELLAGKWLRYPFGIRAIIRVRR